MNFHKAFLLGIQKFLSLSAKANRYALTLDLLTIDRKAQQYYYKPQYLEGGGLSFSKITADSEYLLERLVEPQNLNGIFQIINSDDQSLTIEA